MVIFDNKEEDNDIVLSPEELEELKSFKMQLSTEGVVNVNNVRRIQNSIGKVDERLAKVKLNRFTEHLTKSGVAYIMDIVDTILEKQDKKENKTINDTASEVLEKYKEKRKIIKYLINFLSHISVKDPNDLINDTKLVYIDESIPKIVKLKNKILLDMVVNKDSIEYDILLRVFTSESLDVIRDKNLVTSPVISYLFKRVQIESIITCENLYTIIINRKLFIDKLKREYETINKNIDDFLNIDNENSIDISEFKQINLEIKDIDNLREIIDGIKL